MSEEVLRLALKSALIELYVDVSSRTVQHFTEGSREWWVQPDCSDLYEKAVDDVLSLSRGEKDPRKYLEEFSEES